MLRNIRNYLGRSWTISRSFYDYTKDDLTYMILLQRKLILLIVVDNAHFFAVFKKLCFFLKRKSNTMALYYVILDIFLLYKQRKAI